LCNDFFKFFFDDFCGTIFGRKDAEEIFTVKIPVTRSDGYKKFEEAMENAEKDFLEIMNAEKK
jgi:hypothetical protein